MAGKRGWFTWQEIVDGLHHKIMRRNPHVFGDLVLTDLEAVNLHWQWVKINERDRNNEGKNREMYEMQSNKK